MPTDRHDEDGVEDLIPYEKGLPRPLKPIPISEMKEPPRLICAADIESRPIYWFWYPYIPMGMVTMISGDPGLGKSWITMDIAARASSGRAMPGQKNAMPPRKVLILNYEDPPNEVIIPRLDVLGADRSKIMMPVRSFVLDASGVRLMEDDINECSIGLVFIDPIVAAIGAGIDMNKANEVRSIMGALGEIAHRTGTAIVAVRHLRKTGRGDSGKAIYAGLGSIDFTASVRSELLVEETKSGDKVVKHIKCNVGPHGPALHYRYDTRLVTDPHGEEISTARFEWLGLYEGTEIYEVGKAHTAFKKDACRDWLKDYLKDGPKRAGEVYKAAEMKGFSEKTLKRAKDGVVKSVQSGQNIWEWHLLDGPATLNPDLLAEAQKRMEAANDL